MASESAAVAAVPPPPRTPSTSTGTPGSPGSDPVLLGRTAEVVWGVGPTSSKEAGELKRAGTLLERAGTALQRAGSNLQLQRAATLPKDDSELRHAATMPMMFDLASDRPFCGGLWKTQQLVGFLLGIALLVVMLCARPVRTYPEANEMLGITALCACFWVFEVIPIYMTALFPLVLMPLFKVTSSEVAAGAYWNWVSLLVVGTYLLGIALEEVQLPRRVALCLLLKLGVVGPSALLACFMAICWFGGMFVNSIAVTLLMTPFASGLMNAAEEQVRNAADAEAAQAEERGEAGPAVEELARGGAERGVREVQRFADCVFLGIAYAATAGGMATVSGSLANYLLAGGTIAAHKVTYSSWFGFALPTSAVTAGLAYWVLWARYVSRLRFGGIQREVLEAEYESLVNEVGLFSRDELLVGLAQLAQVLLFVVRPFAISPYVQTEYGTSLVNDSTLACIPALLLFFLPSVVHPGKALLTWPAVHEKFDFGLLILIGGGLAINAGFTESGLNVALGSGIAALIPHVHGVLLNFVIIVCVALCSQVLSSVGTAAAMQPVLAAAAEQAVVNPLSLMLPATIAASLAFALPTATPPNVVVLAKSQDLGRPLRIRDFVCNGLPLLLAASVAGALLVQVMGSAVLDSTSPYPKWACMSDAANCMWVHVPGLVQGQDVHSQACIVQTGDSDGTICQLWNGTTLNTMDHMQPL